MPGIARTAVFCVSLARIFEKGTEQCGRFACVCGMRKVQLVFYVGECVHRIRLFALIDAF